MGAFVGEAFMMTADALPRPATAKASGAVPGAVNPAVYSEGSQMAGELP
jgi:hypothetical protein